jgi:prepilin-type N-terminal cleavage/methylation domain-containing protein
MLNKLKNKSGRGFTIIEVMIVLAIGGLIIAVVLIAIPQLQRNQRNSSRQAVVNRVSTEISNYSANNNGRIPGATDLDEFATRYLAGVNIDDPRVGEPMPIVTASAPDGVPSLSQDLAIVTVNPGSDPSDPDDDYSEKTGGGDLGVIYYATGAECDGESVNSVTGSRAYALYSVQEGGAIYCIDNN